MFNLKYTRQTISDFQLYVNNQITSINSIVKSHYSVFDLARPCEAHLDASDRWAAVHSGNLATGSP